MLKRKTPVKGYASFWRSGTALVALLASFGLMLTGCQLPGKTTQPKPSASAQAAKKNQPAPSKKASDRPLDDSAWSDSAKQIFQLVKDEREGGFAMPELKESLAKDPKTDPYLLMLGEELGNIWKQVQQALSYYEENKVPGQLDLPVLQYQLQEEGPYLQLQLTAEIPAKPLLAPLPEQTMAKLYHVVRTIYAPEKRLLHVDTLNTTLPEYGQGKLISEYMDVQHALLLSALEQGYETSTLGEDMQGVVKSFTPFVAYQLDRAGVDLLASKKEVEAKLPHFAWDTQKKELKWVTSWMRFSPDYAKTVAAYAPSEHCFAVADLAMLNLDTSGFDHVKAYLEGASPEQLLLINGRTEAKLRVEEGTWGDAAASEGKFQVTSVLDERTLGPGQAVVLELVRPVTRPGFRAVMTYKGADGKELTGIQYFYQDQDQTADASPLHYYTAPLPGLSFEGFSTDPLVTVGGATLREPELTLRPSLENAEGKLKPLLPAKPGLEYRPGAGPAGLESHPYVDVLQDPKMSGQVAYALKKELQLDQGTFDLSEFVRQRFAELKKLNDEGSANVPWFVQSKLYQTADTISLANNFLPTMTNDRVERNYMTLRKKDLVSMSLDEGIRGRGFTYEQLRSQLKTVLEAQLRFWKDNNELRNLEGAPLKEADVHQDMLNQVQEAFGKNEMNFALAGDVLYYVQPGYVLNTMKVGLSRQSALYGFHPVAVETYALNAPEYDAQAMMLCEPDPISIEHLQIPQDKRYEADKDGKTFVLVNLSAEPESYKLTGADGIVLGEGTLEAGQAILIKAKLRQDPVKMVMLDLSQGQAHYGYNFSDLPGETTPALQYLHFATN